MQGSEELVFVREATGFVDRREINNLALKGEVCCSPVVVRLRV
jgi:hypothetical protein